MLCCDCYYVSMFKPSTYVLYKYDHSIALINFQVERAVAYHLLNIYYYKSLLLFQLHLAITPRKISFLADYNFVIAFY